MAEHQPAMVNRTALERRIQELDQKRREYRLRADEIVELRMLEALDRLLVKDGEA